MHDYYSILGVSKKATPDEIRTAYRTLSRTVHPDKVAQGEGLAKLINEAYGTLKDPVKRAAYDRAAGGDNVREMPRPGAGPSPADAEEMARRCFRPDGQIDFLGVLGVMAQALPPDYKQHLERRVHPILDALGFQGPKGYQPPRGKGKKRA